MSFTRLCQEPRLNPDFIVSSIISQVKYVMKTHENRRTGRSNLRQIVLGFVVGAAFGTVTLLVRHTQRQLHVATALNNSQRFDSLIPPPQRKCHCDDARVRGGEDSASTTSTRQGSEENATQDFDPQAPAVIVTKIQGDSTFGALNQMLCLLKYAYNHRVNYDIVVFSADPISDENLEALRATIAPANLNVVVDNPGLQVMVDALPEDQRKHLLQRCGNARDSSDLVWRTLCNETTSAGSTVMPIAYNWQAEFRALHIWKHPALTKYKYMLWMDTDAFCTRVWQKDPIATMRRNDLVLLFDKFPAGRANGVEFVNKTMEAFGHRVCEIAMKNGKLYAVTGYCKRAKFLRQVYGFFHVTDLDFYRSEPVTKWLKIMIGDSKFSRMYDDQIGVTMPAAYYAGNRSWDMRHHGLHMSVMHNFVMDGNDDERTGSYFRFWEHEAEETFPEAYGHCKIVVRG